jgi:acylphosphatase
MLIYAEGSAQVIPITFLDRLGQAVIPTRASYRIDDLGSGSEVRGDTEITQLDSTINIGITETDTAILDPVANEYESRVVLIEYEYGVGGDTGTQAVQFKVLSGLQEGAVGQVDLSDSSYYQVVPSAIWRHNTYEVGGRVTLTGRFRYGTAKTAFDPDVVGLKIKLPNGIVSTYIYGTNAELEKVTTGQYKLELDISQYGAHYYYWYSTGTGKTAGENMFDVRKSKVLYR